MSSRAGSTVLTFLMSIPVAAVGLMAVFGVPPLSSVIAASRGNHDINLGFEEDDRSTRSGRSERGTTDEEAPSWSDSDSETDLGSVTDIESDETERDDLGFSRSESKGGRKRSSSPLADARSSESDNDALRFDDEKPETEKSSSKSRGLKRDAANPFPEDAPTSSRGSRVSMKESLKKLNSLNVKKYHLVPGSEPNTWLFVCMFAPGDDQKVIHRFESEDADPDQAVAKTVEQIDAWLLKRFKDNTSLSQMAN